MEYGKRLLARAGARSFDLLTLFECNWENAMRKTMLLTVTAFAMAIAGSAVQAQTPLSAYVDANGFIDVQTLTCAQLAGTYQQDADALTMWYSGWYNGLARKHFLDYAKARETEHEVILYCEANPQVRIIDAMAVVFKDERARLGIEMR
jgi:hypothetical protein